MSILHTQKCQANLFYYIGAVLFTTGIWSTFLLPAANDAAKNIATKPAMELMKVLIRSKRALFIFPVLAPISGN